MNSPELFTQPTVSEPPSKSATGLSDAIQNVGEATDTLRVPVIAETISVGKRVIETGQVRLIKTVREDQQHVDIPLLTEQIDVERMPMDQLVDDAPATRREGDTTIYPVLREEYVVVKRLRLVEEIRVTKRQVQTTERQTISVRQEMVKIERTAINPTSERSDSPGVDSSGKSSL